MNFIVEKENKICKISVDDKDGEEFFLTLNIDWILKSKAKQYDKELDNDKIVEKHKYNILFDYYARGYAIYSETGELIAVKKD